MNQSNVRLGGSLEKYFVKCLSVKNWKVTRIPDGCRQVSSTKLIRVKSPFDYFASKQPARSFFNDTKTIQGDRFPYSAINQDQIKELLEHERNGHKAGYVIHFRQPNYYGFASASQLALMIPRESIMHYETVNLGSEIDIDRLFGE